MPLVDEIRELANKQIEPVDVSVLIDYIKTCVGEGYAIFYPAHQIGIINADVNRFATKEQLITLRQEGFTVTPHYVEQKPGYLVHETKRYVGEKVTW